MDSIILVLEEGDEYHTAVYAWHVFRFLMDDGSVVDVKGIQDTSTLREAVLKLFPKGSRIAGSTTLPEPEPEEKPAPTKSKRPAKKAAVTAGAS